MNPKFTLGKHIETPIFSSAHNRTDPLPAPLRLGLTGGIGCGKSTVRQHLAERQWLTCDTDALARDLLVSPNLRPALIQLFGDGVFTPDGLPDRALIAQKVFNDPAALRELEALLHPLIRSQWLAFLEMDSKRPRLVEIPLLFEKKLENHFDFIVCVSVSPSIQLDRLTARGLHREQASLRLQRQMPLSEKEKRAHFVINNNGRKAALEAQINLLLTMLPVLS